VLLIFKFWQRSPYLSKCHCTAV